MRSSRLRFALVVLAALAALSPADASEDPPPDWVPSLELSYLDPASGDRVECSEPCRRFKVPDGAVLDLRVVVANRGGEPRVDGPTWDLWWDQRLHPFPGIDPTACIDAADGTVDAPCWQELADRVDWRRWQELAADLSCVPEEPGGCVDVTLRVPVSAAFDGDRGRGVYSVALWVDRFRAGADCDEFNNFVGPVRVNVGAETDAEEAAGAPADLGRPAILDHTGVGTLIEGATGRPFGVAAIDDTVEQGFTLSSPRSRATLGFVLGLPGAVTVEVNQAGSWEKMHVAVTKVSTGAILQEARGQRRLHFDGVIGPELLRDDRRFEVVVSPEQGTRNVRGTVRVTYPARARLIANPPSPAAASQ